MTFQRAGDPVDDGYNTVPGDFADYASAMANVVFGTGQERREAAQEQSAISATFYVLRNPKTAALTTKDRIVYEGDWDIVSVAQSKSYNRELEITAVRGE